jgi:hypothetical protein
MSSEEPIPPPLTEDEGRKVMRAALQAAPDGQTEDEIFRVIKWAEGVRVDGWMLDLILKGTAGMFVDPADEMKIRTIADGPTPSG